jgi:hypothetical protein
VGRIGLLAALVAVLLAGSARAQAPEETCGSASPSAAPCIGFEKLADAAAAECRRIGVPEAQCAVPLSHQVSSKIADEYGKTWLHRSAAYQYGLAHALPLLRAQWLGTHNSFNSANDDPTLSHTDSNQQLSLTQQLDVDMRSIELDLHYLPTRGAVVVCHGRGPDEAHFGCTTEQTFAELLPEVGDWLKKHPKQVLLLYLEDELGDPAGYTETVKTLDSVLGGALYKPSPSEIDASKGCASLPLGISRDDVRARGAQVILVGNCRAGWSADVYGWDDSHVESGSTPDYKAFPACDKTYARDVYDSKLVRYYEDSTFVSAATDPGQTPEQQGADALTPERVGWMTSCGVGLFGFDQLLPNDGRIEASIWSWKSGEPDAKGGLCGLQRINTRWDTRPCSTYHRAVCRSAAGLTLTPKRVRYDRARAACRKAGASFDLPRTGYENASIRAAATGLRGVWLRYRLSG